MRTHIPSAVVIVLGVLAASVWIGEADAKPREGQLSQVNCECSCAVRREGRPTMIETKTFSAPNGDPQRCGGMDGTSCRNTREDGTTALGQLENCSAVVTSIGGTGRPAIKDTPAKIVPTEGESTLPGRPVAPETQKLQ